MCDIEFTHSSSGWLKIVEHFIANVAQQTEIVVVAIRIPIEFSHVTREILLVMLVHSENKGKRAQNENPAQN